MSLIAEFRIDSPGLVLYETRQAVPDVRIDVEQEIGVEPERPLFFFWVEPTEGTDADDTLLRGVGENAADPDRETVETDTDALAAFERAIHEDPSVTDVVLLNRLPDRHLYRVQFSAALETVMYPYYVELGAAILALRGDANGWYIRMRFPDREAFTDFRSICTENEVTFDLQRVYSGPTADGAQQFDDGGEEGLTASQREAIEVGLRVGYFDVPRGSTLADVAEELDISSQSASERLRRGVRTLARNAVGDQRRR